MKVIFAGGGTGGHLYPAVAMAEELLKLDPEADVSFAGTERGIEATEIPRLGFRLHMFRVRGFSRGKTPADLVHNAGVLADFAGSLGSAVSLLRKEKPDVVVGTGGFVSAPLLLAAQLLGIPNLIQEQNAFPGLTTRLLSMKATELHLSFEESRAYVKRKRGVWISGNPARSFSLADAGEARKSFGLDPKKTTLLVFGGSRGARSINAAVKQWLEEFDGRFNLIWQTGSLDIDAIRKEHSPSSSLWFGPYIDTMGTAYSAADMVLCRAGASTVAELTNLGKPAILVPYPHATGNHQFFNAEALSKDGAAVLIEDGDIGSGSAKDEVVGLLDDGVRRAEIAAACKRHGMARAALELAERIQQLAS